MTAASTDHCGPFITRSASGAGVLGSSYLAYMLTKDDQYLDATEVGCRLRVMPKKGQNNDQSWSTGPLIDLDPTAAQTVLDWIALGGPADW